METLKQTKKQIFYLMETATELLKFISTVKITEANANIIVNFYLHFATLSQYYGKFMLGYKLSKYTGKVQLEDLEDAHKNFEQHLKLLKDMAGLLNIKAIVPFLTKLNSEFKQEKKPKKGAVDYSVILGRDENNMPIYGTKEIIEVPRKVGGAPQMIPDFYAQHRSQLEKWVKNPPAREKIIKHLELWTGAKGEDAVIATINHLRNSLPAIIMHVAEVYGMRFGFNESLDNFYGQSFQILLNYYIEHRNRYIKNSFEKQRIEFGKVNKFFIKDDFLKLSVEFRKCDFSQFRPVIQRIMKGINNLDLHIVRMMSKFVFEEAPEAVIIIDISEDADVLARKRAKQEILAAAEVCGEDLSCLELEGISINVNGEKTLKSLLKNIAEFIAVETEVVKRAEGIKDMFRLQSENLNTVLSKIIYLAGPSIEPCVKRIFKLIMPLILYEKNNIEYDKEEWQFILDFKWDRLVTRDGRFLTKEWDALLMHVFN